MNSVADSGLEYLVKQHKKRIVNNFLFVISIVVFGVIGIYFLGREVITVLNILCMFLFLGTMGFMQYSQVVPNGRILNNTVTELTIETDHILVKTFPFKVLFWINKLPKEVVFNISDLKVRQVSYPVKQIFDLDGGVLKISDKEKEVYVIVDYFDEELKQILMSFKK